MTRIEQISKQINSLKSEVKRVLQPFDLRPEYSNFNTISLPELNKYQNPKLEDSFFEHHQGLGELLSHHINNLDWPVSKDSGKKFAVYFGLDVVQSDYILNACATEEQMAEYESFHQRQMAEYY